MNNWISKAANVFKRDVEETPQPFELACECGQKHGGVRRNRQQHIVCKSCGMSLFVLPRDVYPPPLERKPAKKKKKSKSQSMDALEDSRTPEDDALDEVVVLEKQAPRHRKQRQSSDDESTEKSRKKSKKEKVPPPPPTPGFFERTGTYLQQAVQGFFKFWSPFRLAMLGILMLMGFAIVWSVMEGVRSRAVSSVKEYSEEGMQAVADQDWIKARRAFEQAANAVNVLDRHDPEAEGIRQFHRETDAMTNLCLVSLFDLLEIAEETYENSGAEDWQKQFLVYQNRWIVMTGPVERVEVNEVDDKKETYELYFPWSPGTTGHSVSVRANFADFGKIVPDNSRMVVTFAGELDSCEYSPSEKTWIVTFKSDTGFLWSHEQTYAGLNFEFSELESEQELQSRLARQTTALGAEK